MEMHLLYLTKEAGSPLFPSPMLAACLQQSWLLVGTLRLAYPAAIKAFELLVTLHIEIKIYST